MASDEQAEKKAMSDIKLLRVSDASGTLKIKTEATGNKLTRDMLDTSDTFILDSGSQIFVWVGKKCTMVSSSRWIIMFKTASLALKQCL